MVEYVIVIKSDKSVKQSVVIVALEKLGVDFVSMKEKGKGFGSFLED